MFQIYVDSAANIPAQIVKKYGIRVLSFMNSVNGEPLICFDPDLTPEQEREKGKAYYDSIRNGAEVKTALIGTGVFAEEFAKVMNEGEDVLYICLSKNISGNYNSARMGIGIAMDETDGTHKVRLIDALNASLGQGILAIYASEMRAKGMNVDEVADVIETYPAKMNGLFTVGDLKYLSRTGRISGSKAMIGNMLQIKPILIGNKDGYIVQYGTVRGRKASLKKLADLVCNNIVDPENQIIGIAHADAYEEAIQLKQRILERVHVREVIDTSYDFCTGSHVGPDTVAVFFMAKDRELVNC